MELIPWKRKTTLAPQEVGESPMADFRRELDDVFERLWRSPLAEFWPFERSGEALMPAPLDVSETETEVIVKADMPGIDPKQLQITVEGDRMTITGRRQEEKEHQEKNLVRRERRYAGYQRTFPLPSTVDADNARAEYKDGVLMVRLPRREDAKPKRIAVKS